MKVSSGSKKILVWIATVISIGASTWRSFALGYQSQSYVVTALCQTMLIWNAVETKESRLMLLNVFYLLSSAFAAYRWWHLDI